jgi:pimeloyl-ACP methyl ester carboxylesterase
VKRLVLVNAAGIRVDGAKMGELFTDDLDKLRHLLFHDPNDPSVALAMPKSFEDARIIQWLRAAEATARVAWNPYLHNPRLPAHLRRVECPSLVLWGRQDKLFPLAIGEYYAQHLPNSRLEVIDNCGHMLPFEKTDEFVKRTGDFLAT